MKKILFGLGETGIFGYLGDGTRTGSKTPIQIKPEIKFKKVSAGYNHGMAIDEKGNLWVWGYNEYGQIGDGTTTTRLSPIQIKEGTKFIETAVDSYRSSNFIDEEGNLWACGYGDEGRLGDGTESNRKSPIQIKEGTIFKKVTRNMGAGANSGRFYAIDNDGNLWGSGRFVYPGWGGVNNIVKNTTKIKPDIKFKEVVAGEGHTLAIDINGNLWVWGYSNAYGQLGNGTTNAPKEATQIF